MALLSLDEEARIWGSLDDNLREQVRTGKLTIEEAGKFVIPTGDNFLARGRAEAAASGAVPGAPPASTPTSEVAPSGEEYTLGTTAKVALANPVRTFDSIGATVDSMGIERGEEIEQVREQGYFATLTDKLANRGRDYLRNKDPLQRVDGAAVIEGVTGAISDVVDTGLLRAQAAMSTTEDIRMRQEVARQKLDQNLRQMAETTAYIRSLPQNPYTQAWVESVDNGDWATAAWNAAPTLVTVLGEQAPDIAVTSAVIAGTAYATKNPTAVAAATRIATAGGSSMEYGADLSNIWDSIPEDQRTYEKFKEAQEQARQVTASRALVEAAIPGIGARLGATNMQRVATELAAQVAAGGAGEAVSSRIASGEGDTLTSRLRTGETASWGELTLEMLADSVGVASEAGPSLLRAAAEDRAFEAAGDRVAQVKKEFTDGILKLESDQAQAEINRANFDAEVEADRAIEALKMQSPTQTEMPFGSDMTADPQANDRVPTIQDMFSGESTAAPKVQQQLDARAEREAAGLPPPETDEAFEVRTQRESTARNQIDQRKQNDFEVQKQKEADRRRLMAEDQTVLKAERQLQSTADITREAQNRLEYEKQQIRSRPENRRGANNARLTETLAAFERKRKPELIKEVREERLKRINDARERIIAEENRQLELEDIDVQNELGRRQDERRAKEAAAANVPVDGDLFSDQPQTELLPPTEQPARPAFTGTLTEKQRERELAAGQLNRQKQTEKLAPAEKAKQTAALEAEIPTVAKAVEQAQQKKVSLTTKAYAKTEREAVSAIVEDELTKNPNRPKDEVVRAVAARVAKWRESNPRPASVPAPATSDKLTEQASRIAKQKETTQKAKETKATNRELKREIEKGATPEQAAEIVRNRKLTPAEDTALRAELGRTRSTLDPAVNVTQVEINGKMYTKQESTELRAAFDKVQASNSGTKLADLLDAVAISEDASEGHKWLARRLSGLAKNLGLGIVSETPEGVSPTWAGAFVTQENAVWINNVTSEIILHEALHAVTSNLITSNLTKNNPRVKAAIDRLEQARNVAIMELSNDPEMVKKLFPEAALRVENIETGPLSSIKEFISYGLTNRSVQAWLGSIKVPGEPFTLWQSFKKAVRSLFTPRDPMQRTVLDDIMEATNDLLELQEASPAINAMATANIRQRAGLGFTRPDAMDDGAIEAEFSNPVTKRSMIVLGNGKFQIKFKPEWLSSPVGSLMDALTSGAARSSVITEVFERSQSSTSAMILRAEQMFRAIDYSLEKQATRSKGKETITGLRDKFTADIQKFEQMPIGLEKRQFAKTMRDTYGRAARSYFMMRRTMDNLSRDILRQRLDDPRPFTEQEAGIYRSIKENIGQYYTRVYASNTKGIGEERAKKLWKEYEKWAKGDTKVQFKDGYEVVRNAAVFVRDNLLTIPDIDTLETMPLAKLQKLADAWGIMPLTGADLENPMVAEGRREALIQGLQEFADETPEAKDQKALQLVEELLFGRDNATLTNYFRGAKQDRTIVTDREQVPAPLRKLMGEYEDLPLRAMVTITRQAEFRARNKAFNELLAQEQGKRILTAKEFTAQKLSKQDWKKLDGVGYGSLDGLYVREDLANKIEDSAEVQRTFDQVLAMAENRPLETINFWTRKGVAVWAKAAGTIKSIQLVWNLGNMAFNFLGGPLILLSNGNMNPKHVKRAFDTAMALIRGAAAPGGVLTADMEKVVRAGITDSAFMGEIRAVELEKLRQLTLEALQSKTELATTKAGGLWRAGKRSWRETYAMADVVWKIANFYTEEAKLESFYKAEGIEMSAEAIEREAARKTNVSNFSYKRVPDLFKIFEKAGLTYIMPYIYETFRAPAGSFAVGISDMAQAVSAKTPKGKAIMLASGARRMTGAALAMGAAQQMIFALAKEIAGVEDDEDDWVEKLKAFLPDFKRESDYLYMGKDENGKPILFEFSRLDPMGPAAEFYRLGLRGAEPEEYLDTAKKLIIGNPYGTGILKAFLGTGSTNTRIEDIHPALYETLVDVGNAAGRTVGLRDPKAGMRLAKVVDSVLPSWYIRAADPRNTGPADDDYGNILPYMGIQLHKIEPERTIKFAANAFTAERANLRTQMYDFLRNQHQLTDKELLTEFVALREREEKSFDELEHLYEGMLTLEIPPQQALGQLAAGGVPPEELRHLMAGGYRPENSGMVTLEGMKRSWKEVSNDPNVTDEQKAQYLANLERVLRLAGEGRVPIN